MADDRSLQRWGVLVGAGTIVAALGATQLTSPRGDRAAAPSPPAASKAETAGPAAAPAASAGPVVGEATVEPADTPARPPAAAGGSHNASFIVAFENNHPMGRAQQLAAQGRLQDASEAARSAIRTGRDLRGLCFDRFTAGGAEVVLRACNSVPRNEIASFERTWTARLTSMAGIQYAEPNHTLYPEAGK